MKYRLAEYGTKPSDLLLMATSITNEVYQQVKASLPSDTRDRLIGWRIVADLGAGAHLTFAVRG